MSALPPERATELLAERLRDWAIVDGRLRKEWRFADFAAALAFVNRAGAECEKRNHHANFELGWGRAAATIWTHSVGGLTEADFELAAALDEL
ncbi:MAG: 4a-hydroxytetrahydrobiopterin dehydratase [Planctomycetota bacterium]|nr:MAG: 4a-hydroxytetrahydrobiopterin dehydratase [Planctomycetota bacterium]